MAKTNAQKQRAMRQEELRNLLSNKGLVQKVIEDIGKIDKLAATKLADFDDVEEYLAEIGVAKDKVQMIRVAIDSRLKLVNKYLPDLKQAEVDLNHGVQDSLANLLKEIDGTAGTIDDE